MITITCTNCQTLLEIDDAFAGGVCRCRHCGTIQTVPAVARRPSRPVGPGEAVPPPPAYAAKPAHHEQVPPPAAYAPAQPPGFSATPSGTGLDEIAAAVASSGLVGTGLSGGRLRKALSGTGSPSIDAGQAASARQKQVLAIVGGGAGVLLLMGILLGYALSGGTNEDGNARNPAPAPPPPGQGTGPTPVIASASFLGIPIKGPTVVYFIDRGAGTREVFDGVREAVSKSLESLKPETRFQVVFWDVLTEQRAWPADSMTEATPANIEAAISYLQDTSAYRTSSYERPLREALKLNPADLFIVSGKGELTEVDVKAVGKLVKAAGGTTRIHAVGVGNNSSPAALQGMAAAGGVYRNFDSQTLRDLLDRE
jgi:hypothetical protein